MRASVPCIRKTEVPNGVPAAPARQDLTSTTAVVSWAAWVEFVLRKRGSRRREFATGTVSRRLERTRSSHAGCAPRRPGSGPRPHPELRPPPRRARRLADTCAATTRRRAAAPASLPRPHCRRALTTQSGGRYPGGTTSRPGPAALTRTRDSRPRDRGAFHMARAQPPTGRASKQRTGVNSGSDPAVDPLAPRWRPAR